VSLLQPVLNNSNPLYIQTGNPDLKPAVIHNINVGYNSFNPKNFRGTTLNAYAAFTRNKIVTASWLDTLGRQVSQPQNANGTYNIGIDIASAFPLRKKGSAINTYTMISHNRDVNYMNDKTAYVSNLYVNESISFAYSHEQLFDFSLRVGINYSGAWYAQQKENNVNLYKYNASFNGNISLPLGFDLGANINYQRNAGAAAGYNQHVTMINAYMAKSVLQGKRGSIKIQGFDLLNQNQGFARTLGAGYIEDARMKVLQRFFIMSFTYFLKP
jgi:hypothetical protein